MAQAAGHHPGHVVVADFVVALESGQGPRGPIGDDVAPQAIHIQSAADGRDAQAQVVVQVHLGQPLLGRHHPGLQAVLHRLHAGVEAIGIGIEGGALIHHLHPQLRFAHGAHLHAHAEAIQQLGPQLAFFRVARTDQHEAGRVAHADAFPFDRVPAGGRRIQQYVDQVVVEQVDFIDIQKTAIRLGQQAGLEGPHAFAKGLFDVDGAAKPVFSGPQGQVHHRHLALFTHQGFTRLGPLAHLGALQVWIAGGAVVGIARHHLDFRQQVGEGPDGGGFARAPIPHDHHAADAGIDDVEQQRQLHLLLADDGREGEDPALPGLTHGAAVGGTPDCFTGAGSGAGGATGSRLSTWGGVASAG